MAKCLVTKLKATVENDALLRLNEKVLVYPNSKFSDRIVGLKFKTGGTLKVRVIGNVTIKDEFKGEYGKEYSINKDTNNGNRVFIKGTDSFKLIFEDENNDLVSITSWDNSSGNVYQSFFDYFKYTNNIETIVCVAPESLKLDEYLYMADSLKTLNIRQLEVKGDLEVLLGLNNLKSLTIGETPNITKRRSTINKLQENGVSVTLGSSEIIEDV